jgi:DNA-binding SARP family transcriptional activator
VVTVEELVDQVWDDSPPANPRGAVQTNVQRLRRALGPEASELIRTRTRGYAIEVKPRQLDLLSFPELVERRGGSPRSASPPRSSSSTSSSSWATTPGSCQS